MDGIRRASAFTPGVRSRSEEVKKGKKSMVCSISSSTRRRPAGYGGQANENGQRSASDQGQRSILLKAKSVGAIPSITTEIEKLISAGSMLSHSVIQEAITIAGE
jgi:hypothetical protein